MAGKGESEFARRVRRGSSSAHRVDTATPTTGWPELSSTRPDKLVGAPGDGPVTVRAMVSDEETDPSEATKTRLNVPTCVASGVKLNTPVWPLNAICAGNVGDAGAACCALYVTGCRSDRPRTP